MPFLNKSIIKGVLAGHTVPVVTYWVTKMATTCLPMTGQFFDSEIVASNDRVVIMTNQNLSLGKFWSLF